MPHSLEKIQEIVPKTWCFAGKNDVLYQWTLQATESVALYQAVAQLYPDELYQHDVGST